MNRNKDQTRVYKVTASKIDNLSWRCPECSYLNASITNDECEFCDTVTEDPINFTPFHTDIRGEIITVDFKRIERAPEQENVGGNEDKQEEEEQVVICPICQDKVTAGVVLNKCKHLYCM